MNERRKGPLTRRLADRRAREASREDRRRGLERLLDREGRSDEDIRRNANEWWDKLDRRSGTDRRQQPDRRSI